MKSLLVPLIPLAVAGITGVGFGVGIAITVGVAGGLIALAKALGAEKTQESLNEHYVAGGIVGIGAINQIPPRVKTDYENAFEHFLGQKYGISENEVSDEVLAKIKPEINTPEEKNLFNKTVNWAKDKISKFSEEEKNELADIFSNPKLQSGIEQLAIGLKKSMETEEEGTLTEWFIAEAEDQTKLNTKNFSRIITSLGLSAAALGAFSAITQSMGYTDVARLVGDWFIDAHDYVKVIGGGPAAFGILLGGIITALKGVSMSVD